jgi:hypothetical protein
VIEFFQIVTEHRQTPIELMTSLGLLGPDVTIGHRQLRGREPLMNYSGGRDLELMAAQRRDRSRTAPSTSHAAGRISILGTRYRRAGV